MGEYYDWKLGRLEAALREAINTALREGVAGRDINVALRSAIIAEVEYPAMAAIHSTQKLGVAANEDDGGLG
jgi:hypothetical protein